MSLGDEHCSDQHRDHEQERPYVADERTDRRAALNQPLGERCAPQEEEPRRADDEPEAPELRSELANVEEQRADEPN
jgi:hypothetical protein